MSIDPAITAWATEHWWMAFWILLWALFFAYSILRIAIMLPFRLCSRVLRVINVTVRGWPPKHLDADGDWAPAGKAPGELVSETVERIGNASITTRKYVKKDE